MPPTQELACDKDIVERISLTSNLLLSLMPLACQQDDICHSSAINSFSDCLLSIQNHFNLLTASCCFMRTI